MSRLVFVSIFIVTLLVWLGYEVWALITPHEGDTISEIIWQASAKRPFVPFIIGFGFGLLFGHFFWQRVP